MVYCIRKLNSSFKKDHKAIKTRNMKNFSEEAFLQDVATINWQGVLGTSDDVNKLVERFSTLFSLMIETRPSSSNSSIRKVLSVDKR